MVVGGGFWGKNVMSVVSKNGLVSKGCKLVLVVSGIFFC